MFAYVDETGNTGANIFDAQQPDFFTGALITKTNFDLVHGEEVASICAQVGIPSIHASVVGWAKIEQVSIPLLHLLKKVDARFFLSRVEKRYLVATKVFDTFFDSGENPAVPWTAYNVRVLRIALAFKVASILTYEIAEQFWAMLMAKTEQAARAMIPGICNAILERVPEIKDARSREIVTSALEWSRDHPQALDIFISGRQAKNGHMPNMVAFANLLDGLDMLSRKWGRPLRKIVHDRQSQFEQSLAEWHKIFSNASDEPIRLPGETQVLQKVKGSTFEVSPSSESAGIQVTDLVLWLYRQLRAGKRIGPNASALLGYALRKGWHHDFSFEGVGSAAEQQLAAVMATEQSAETKAKAREIGALLEKQRLDAMAAYEVDGLMPYERQEAARALGVKADEKEGSK